MERVFSYIIAEMMVLADAVSDCWFVVQPYGTSPALCNILDLGSIPQNITTTESGGIMLSNLVFISKYVISWTTLMISEALVGTQVFLS
jgi:hypothetical protein